MAKKKEGKMYQIKVEMGTTLLDDAYKVRYSVFCTELGIPIEREKEYADNDALHLVIYDHGDPIATGRLLDENGLLYVGRIGVLKDYRGQGLGLKVLENLLEIAGTQNRDRIYVRAQEKAIDFYRKAGFEPYGPRYIHKNLEHQGMCLEYQSE